MTLKIFLSLSLGIWALSPVRMKAEESATVQGPSVISLKSKIHELTESELTYTQNQSTTPLKSMLKKLRENDYALVSDCAEPKVNNYFKSLEKIQKKDTELKPRTWIGYLFSYRTNEIPLQTFKGLGLLELLTSTNEGYEDFYKQIKQESEDYMRVVKDTMLFSGELLSAMKKISALGKLGSTKLKEFKSEIQTLENELETTKKTLSESQLKVKEAEYKQNKELELIYAERKTAKDKLEATKKLYADLRDENIRLEKERDSKTALWNKKRNEEAPLETEKTSEEKEISKNLAEIDAHKEKISKLNDEVRNLLTIYKDLEIKIGAEQEKTRADWDPEEWSVYKESKATKQLGIQLDKNKQQQRKITEEIDSYESKIESLNDLRSEIESRLSATNLRLKQVKQSIEGIVSERDFIVKKILENEKELKSKRDQKEKKELDKIDTRISTTHESQKIEMANILKELEAIQKKTETQKSSLEFKKENWELSKDMDLSYTDTQQFALLRENKENLVQAWIEFKSNHSPELKTKSLFTYNPELKSKSLISKSNREELGKFIEELKALYQETQNLYDQYLSKSLNPYKAEDLELETSKHLPTLSALGARFVAFTKGLEPSQKQEQIWFDEIHPAELGQDRLPLLMTLLDIRMWESSDESFYWRKTSHRDVKFLNKLGNLVKECLQLSALPQ